jgi:hypothetical protein
MMVEALDSHDDTYWLKACQVNPICDNGAYFNLCRTWLGYEAGINDSTTPSQIVTIRVLQCAGQFSKVKLPIRTQRIKPPISVSEPPAL